MMQCNFEYFEKNNNSKGCPFCQAEMKDMRENEVSEHMTVHKTLGHKHLPSRFETKSMAHSTIPFILKNHFGLKLS